MNPVSDPSGHWKLFASIILQAYDDALKGDAGAHFWITRPDPWLRQICDMLNVEVDAVQRRYWQLRIAPESERPESSWQDVSAAETQNETAADI